MSVPLRCRYESQTHEIDYGRSYDKVPEWYDAVASANHRRGSEDIPILLVGNKLDGKRDMTPKEIDYPRKKKIDYMEISSKANYKIDDVLLYLAKKLLGDGTQLTDEVNWASFQSHAMHLDFYTDHLHSRLEMPK